MTYTSWSVTLSESQEHIWLELDRREEGFTDETGIILRMGSANERRHYYMMPSLIGQARTQNDPCEIQQKICFKMANIFSDVKELIRPTG